MEPMRLDSEIRSEDRCEDGGDGACVGVTGESLLVSSPECPPPPSKLKALTL